MQLKGVGFVQLNGARFLLQGPRFPSRKPLVSVAGPRFPLAEALFNGRIVGHSPGFNCIGPQDASKNIGLGRT